MSLRPAERSSIEAKVVILGTQGVGKTSLVLRHVGSSFSSSVSPTIGASFFNFSMTVNGCRIKLQLWDTAGQERFRSMAPMYYRRANAAMIVYDITSEKSFEEAQTWAKELESKVDCKLALCVVGNKSDLAEQRQVSRDRGEEFAHQLGAMFSETSAASNAGVKEAFLKIAHGVITLFQRNELGAPPNLDPSYSAVCSYTQQHTVTNGSQEPAFQATDSDQPTTGRHTTQQQGSLSRCCS